MCDSTKNIVSCCVAVCAGLLTSTSASVAEGESPPKKPNVLLILSDDLSTALSGFGHPQCRTPELDRLAERGVSFRRMYCQFPICGASRSSLMNGLYPYSTGDLGNTTKFRQTLPDSVTMSQLFKNNGYYAARVSKIYHMGIPFEIIDGTAVADDPESWSEAYNIQCGEQNLPGKKIDHSPGWDGSQTFQRVEAVDGDLAMADGMAATKAIELLKQHRDEPFFLALGFVRPHVPLVAPEKYFRAYPEEEMILAKVPKNDLDDVGKATSRYKTTASLKIRDEDMPGIHSAYYAAVSHMDAQVGRVLTALKELGLQDNTVVVFSSDHGYHLGEHHKWQKQHLFEQTARVPFIVSVPWMKKTHGASATQICELVDLYPTIADVCGLRPPSYLQGQSMRAIMNDSATSQWKKSDALTVSTKGGVSLRTENWRYTEWGTGKQKQVELYDLMKDPEEFTNVADQPAYKSTLKTLASLLTQRKQDAGFRK
ncbi:MAG: sulfatase [Planctomycetales bacterium]|jgi:iduronate 2-sulfatase